MKLTTIVIVLSLFVSCALYRPQIPGYFYDDGYYNGQQGWYYSHSNHLRGIWRSDTCPLHLNAQHGLKPGAESDINP